jgi:hypothetical protein
MKYILIVVLALVAVGCAEEKIPCENRIPVGTIVKHKVSTKPMIVLGNNCNYSRRYWVRYETGLGELETNYVSPEEIE